MHLHPTVLRALIPLATRYGAHGIRLPRDELCLALRHDRHHAVRKTGYAFVLAFLSRCCLRQVRAAGLVTTWRVYGLMQSGRTEQDYVLSGTPACRM